LDIIPYFGAFIGATPAVTLALLSSPWLALKVVLLFFAIHQLEGSIIGPQIMGDNVGLHPLSVIFFLFIGGELGGIPGMLLGVPIAAVGKVFIRHIIRMLI
jgi:predicted PurR-regulated permease PerM